MADWRSKHYKQQVQALREAQEEVVPEAPLNGRAMALDLSVRINEDQAQDMIEAKRSFFFSFIEKEFAALRYQLAQKRNFDKKGEPKKSGARERSFALKEAFERANSKPSYGKDVQNGKPFDKYKKNAPQNFAR